MEASDQRDLTPPRRTRRSFSKAFKADLVARAERGDISVSRLAMEHGINTNQLRKWITLARDREPTAAAPMVPVSVVGAPGGEVAPSGTLEVALGHATLRFHRPWDPLAVATLLRALR